MTKGDYKQSWERVPEGPKPEGPPVHTPTTWEIKATFLGAYLPGREMNAWGEGFDRWLDSVRADAWDEGCAARPMQVVAETERGPMYSMHADNPYRSEKQ